MNMKQTLIASTIGLLAATATISAQACGCYGPGQGPSGCGMMKPGPGMGGGGRGPGWGGAGGGIDSHLDRMSAMLGLTPEQQVEIRAILECQQATRQALQQAMREQVDAVLTPEQRAQHSQLMQGGGGPGGRYGGGCGLGRGAGPGGGPGLGAGVPPANPARASAPPVTAPAN